MLAGVMRSACVAILCSAAGRLVGQRIIACIDSGGMNLAALAARIEKRLLFWVVKPNKNYWGLT